MFDNIFKNIKENPPIVHNITNYVTVNDCANVLLAGGGSPIMADDISEVEEIASICSSLVINIGTLNERTIKSMLLAGRKSNNLNRPVILDPVGAGASSLRTDTTKKLLKEIKFAVIRGNISEIRTIYSGNGSTKGVDADIKDAITEENLTDAVEFAKELSKQLNSVIVITGAIDIIADDKKTYVVRNGHEVMSRITGTGCMLTALIGAFCGANPKDMLDAAAAAVCSMGICGELAHKKIIEDELGTSSFKTYLIDYISKINPEMIREVAKIECK